jgi:DNA-binding NarL/FixJ family response regulator
MKTITIVLADDHELMREGTRYILEQNSDLKVVGEAADGDQALDLLLRFQPDIAILDIHMPKLNGIEIVRQLNDCCPNTKALMLTAYDDDEYILALMEAGAHGYLLKTAKPNDVVNAVRGIYSGEAVLDPLIATKVARFWAKSRFSNQYGPGEMLSDREIEVLKLVAEGLRNKTIANRLHLSVRTVEGHLSNILGKTDTTSRIEAVLYAISNNLVNLEE